MEKSVLIHYTSCEDSLVSILKLGFFYSHQDTITFQKLFSDAGIDVIEPDDHAMVCFTSNPDLVKFGKYGIAVSKEWAISKGARKVEYVKIGSPRYNQLLDLLKKSKPASTPNSAGMLERHLFQKMAAHTASRGFLGFTQEYVNLLNDLKWMQVSSHEYQNEWRVRNPCSMGGIQWINPTLGRINCNIPDVANRQNSIEIAIDMLSSNELLQQLGFLNIPIEAIRYLIVPNKKALSFREKIKNLPVGEVEIVETK